MMKHCQVDPLKASLLVIFFFLTQELITEEEITGLH